MMGSMGLIFWVAISIGVVIFLVPDLYSNKFQHAVESELVKLSPEYEGTNKLHFRFTLIWFLFTLLLLSFLFVLPNKSSQFETVISAMMVLVFSGASLLRGVFAVVKGVFPSLKYFGSGTMYAYSGNEVIKRFGRLVAIASGVIGASAIVSILMVLLK
jgi:hypothetical protein